MFYSRIFFQALLVFGVFSCAQTKLQKSPNKAAVHLSQEQVKEMNENALKRVSSRLEELSISAKASGPDKVRFLASDMYLKASAAVMEGDFQTANIIFKHLMTLVPNDDFIKQKYAVSLIRTGDLEDSEKLLKDIFKNSKNKNSRVGLVLAGVYSSLGKIKESRSIYKKLLSKNSKNEEACIFLSKSYALEKKTKRAIKLLKSCEKNDAKKGIYSYYIGKIYVDSKKFIKAKKYFQRSARIQKDFSQATMALGLVYEELEQFSNAEKTYKRYLKKNPSDTLILSRLVQLMFTREEFKEVIEYAERLSDYEPDNLNLKVKLGILYTDVKKYNNAIKTFKELLVHAPDNDKILYYLGAIFQELAEYENAISYFGKISDKSGLYQDSSLQIAQMLSSLAKVEFLSNKKNASLHKRFISYIDAKVVELEAFQVDLSIIKASYFESLEDNSRAIETLELVKASKTFNNDHRFYLAALYEKEDSFSKAKQLIEEVIELDPKNAHAWNFLGYSLIERGVDMKKAYEYLSKAIALSPNDGYIRDSLGWYYFKVGKVNKALVELKLAIKNVPSDISINKHLAIVYTSLKNFSKAKVYIKKALTEVQSEADRKELVEVLKDLEKSRVPASFQAK